MASFLSLVSSAVDPVLAWIVANRPILAALVFWPLVSALLNYLATRKTPEQWEAWAMGKPVLAFLVTIIRGMGIDPKMVIKAFREFALRRAGQVPEGAVAQAKLPAFIADALGDPEKLKKLEEMARQVAAPQPPSPPTA